MRLVPRRRKMRRDRGDRPVDIDRLAGGVGLVRNAADQRDIERDHGAFPEHDRGARWPQGVADAELIEHIGIGAGDIGDRVMAEHEPLEHRLMDRAADLFLIGADRLESRLLDGRTDDLFEHGIEIGHTPSRVGLASERHQHEAQRRRTV